jgi:hypothetical protein
MLIISIFHWLMADIRKKVFLTDFCTENCLIITWVDTIDVRGHISGFPSTTGMAFVAFYASHSVVYAGCCENVNYHNIFANIRKIVLLTGFDIIWFRMRFTETLFVFACAKKISIKAVQSGNLNFHNYNRHNPRSIAGRRNNCTQETRERERLLIITIYLNIKDAPTNLTTQ